MLSPTQASSISIPRDELSRFLEQLMHAYRSATAMQFDSSRTITCAVGKLSGSWKRQMKEAIEELHLVTLRIKQIVPQQTNMIIPSFAASTEGFTLSFGSFFSFSITPPGKTTKKVTVTLNVNSKRLAAHATPDSMRIPLLVDQQFTDTLLNFGFSRDLVRCN